MTETNNNYIKADKQTVEGLVWQFPNKETLKPQLLAYKHAELQANEVRVKVAYFGVGRLNAENSKQGGFVPGCEIVGTIQAVGKNAGFRQVGETVGVAFAKTVGGFATHVQVDVDCVFPIPNNIPLELAAPLMNAGATAFNVVSKQFDRLKHELNRKPRICIVGMGAVGHMAAKFAHKLGFEVTVFSHTAEKQQLLKTNGVKFESFFLENAENYNANVRKFDSVVIAGDIQNDCVKKCTVMTRRGGRVNLIPLFDGQISIIGTSIVVGNY